MIQDQNLEAALKKMAALSPLEYERIREEEAKKLNVRVSVLDQEVNLRRGCSKKDNTNTNEIGGKVIEPWPEPVDGIELYKELVGIFKKYLVLQQYQAETLALWVIFSYCIDANNIAPKLLIHSPEKRCGKTTLLDVLVGLVDRPIPASNISSAVIYRVIQDIGGTIVIDEADTFIRSNPEINGVINSGHRKTMAYVLRCDGDDHTPKQFSTWAPTVIAMIGKPGDTILDRSILIEMRRKKPGDKVERYIPNKAEVELKTLASKIVRWKEDNFYLLVDADPSTPENLNDRAADNWRPLLAIADVIGGDASMQSRIAVAILSKLEDDEDSAPAGTILLSDIKEIFEENPHKDRISSKDLISKLTTLEDRPWLEWNRGNPISARQVSKLLKPYDIKSKKIRIGEETLQGYMLPDFNDAFERYLTGTVEQSSNMNGLTDVASRTEIDTVPLSKPSNNLESSICYNVPAELSFSQERRGYDSSRLDNEIPF